MTHTVSVERRRWAPRPAGGWPDDLILFDGVCVLCSGFARLVIARDEARRFRFAAIQTPGGRALAVDLGINPDEPETNAAIVHGAAYLKSDAALVILEQLRGLRWTRVLRRLPNRLRDWLYDRIARNRYALFGRHHACPLPSPETAARFVDPQPSAAER
jgi:predicted DCC family thiol-disulfide oxidoreductase YuxK